MDYIINIGNTLGIDTGLVIAIIIITEIFKKIYRILLPQKILNFKIFRIKNRKLYDLLCFTFPVLLGILFGIFFNFSIKESIKLGGFSGFVFSIIKPLWKSLMLRIRSES